MRMRQGMVVLTVGALLAGCTSSPSAPSAGTLAPPALNAPRKLGAGEGAVNLIALPGYVENGSTDPKVDWVSSFENATGCTVSVKTATSADEMLNLMRTGAYDAISAPGDISVRLMADGLAAPVNDALVPNYKSIVDGLKKKPWNSANGVAYGVAHGRAANLLMWRTDAVPAPIDSWAAVFAEDSPFKGKITAHDSPMSIADAALYLKTARPELAIKDPYALDKKQFDAVVALLEKQRPNIRQYWSDYAGEVAGFASGEVVVGPAWQSIAALAKTQKTPVEAGVPKEGTTGWSDTWMVAARAKHRNCAYRWLDHIISPTVNAQVAEYFGQAPSNREACKHTSDKDFCTTYHATDEQYFGRVSFRRTPVRECLDGRPANCVPYADWQEAWAELKG